MHQHFSAQNIFTYLFLLFYNICPNIPSDSQLFFILIPHAHGSMMYFITNPMHASIPKKIYPEHTQWRVCTIFHSVGENSLKAANPPGFLRLSLSPSPSSLIQHDERPASGWLLLWVGGQSIINFPPRAGGRHGISLSRSSVLFCILFASSRVC